MTSTRQMLQERLIGVLLFQREVYREIIDDEEATGTAALIVIVTAFITGLVHSLLNGGMWAVFVQPLAGMVIGMLVWLLSSMICVSAADKLFSRSIDFAVALRIAGFAYLFNLLGVVPVVGLVLGSALTIAGMALGVSEAAKLSLKKGLAVALVVAAFWVAIHLTLYFVIIRPIVVAFEVSQVLR